MKIIYVRCFLDQCFPFFLALSHNEIITRESGRDYNRLIFPGNSWKSSSSEGSRDMQPFLQNSHNATLTSQSGEIPKYLELLADNEDIILRENSTNGYEVPRSIHISDQNLSNINKASTNVDVKGNLHSDPSQEQKECSSDAKEQSEKKCDKRSSISSLNLPERKRASITSMTEKCNTLDSSKLTNPTIKAILKRDSFTSLTDQRKNKRNASERRGSEISLEGRSSSSLSSNISLAPPTRPSSSLISSQNVLPLKNSVIGGTGEGTDNTVAKNSLPKIQRTHSNLQNGKANIPLVINSALLNLLRQTPVVEDSNNIVTYTNINTDAVRVNGS